MAFQAKRKFQRSVQREAVRITSKAGVEYATYEDLSGGGLKLWLDHPLEKDSSLSLEFTLRPQSDRTQEVVVMARVVRCVKINDGYEVGVQFVNLADSTRHIIQRLFASEDGPF